MSDLQKEIKKRQPFDLIEQETMLNLVRTNDRFQFRFARLFREHGLTPSQYNVLRILRGEGNPLPSLEIADRMVAAVPRNYGPYRPIGGDGDGQQGSLNRRPTGGLCRDYKSRS